MKRHNKFKAIDNRLYAWSDWILSIISGLGYGRHPIVSVMEYGTRISTNKLSYVPDYYPSPKNRETHIIVSDLSIIYQRFLFSRYVYHHNEHELITYIRCSQSRLNLIKADIYPYLMAKLNYQLKP